LTLSNDNYACLVETAMHIADAASAPRGNINARLVDCGPCGVDYTTRA